MVSMFGRGQANSKAAILCPRLNRPMGMMNAWKRESPYLEGASASHRFSKRVAPTDPGVTVVGGVKYNSEPIAQRIDNGLFEVHPVSPTPRRRSSHVFVRRVGFSGTNGSNLGLLQGADLLRHSARKMGFPFPKSFVDTRAEPECSLQTRVLSSRSSLFWWTSKSRVTIGTGEAQLYAVRSQLLLPMCV